VHGTVGERLVHCRPAVKEKNLAKVSLTSIFSQLVGGDKIIQVNLHESQNRNLESQVNQGSFGGSWKPHQPFLKQRGVVTSLIFLIF
jgi:hypothetical protein